MKTAFHRLLTVTLTPIYACFLVYVVVDKELATKLLIGSITIMGLLSSLSYSASSSYDSNDDLKVQFRNSANKLLCSTVYAIIALIVNYVWVAHLIDDAYWYQKLVGIFFSIVIGLSYGRGIVLFHYGLKELFSAAEYVSHPKE